MFRDEIEHAFYVVGLSVSASGFDGSEWLARGLQCGRKAILQGNVVALLEAEESTNA
jgi:hypothetical protein